jgi:hypothetical protein
MYCPKCGIEQQDDSQFCRNCGVGQGATSTGGGAAAGVAPARIPVAASLPKKNSNTLLTVLFGLALLFVVCWILWNQNPPKAASPPPPPQQHRLSMPKGAFTVRQLNASNYKFAVPAGAFDVTMKGHFAATGGARNDIEVFVLTEDEFVNWQNRHQVNALYSSGQVTQDSINLTLPADAATYYVVFSNKFSFISPKAVEANVDVNFYTR